MNEDYTSDDLSNDLHRLVKAGLIEVFIREDGEWIYTVNPDKANLSDEEKRALIEQVMEEEDE